MKNNRLLFFIASLCLSCVIHIDSHAMEGQKWPDPPGRNHPLQQRFKWHTQSSSLQENGEDLTKISHMFHYPPLLQDIHKQLTRKMGRNGYVFAQFIMASKRTREILYKPLKEILGNQNFFKNMLEPASIENPTIIDSLWDLFCTQFQTFYSLYTINLWLSNMIHMAHTVSDQVSDAALHTALIKLTRFTDMDLSYLSAQDFYIYIFNSPSELNTGENALFLNCIECMELLENQLISFFKETTFSTDHQFLIAIYNGLLTNKFLSIFFTLLTENIENGLEKYIFAKLRKPPCAAFIPPPSNTHPALTAPPLISLQEKPPAPLSPVDRNSWSQEREDIIPFEVNERGAKLYGTPLAARSATSQERKIFNKIDNKLHQFKQLHQSLGPYHFKCARNTVKMIETFYKENIQICADIYNKLHNNDPQYLSYTYEPRLVIPGDQMDFPVEEYAHIYYETLVTTFNFARHHNLLADYFAHAFCLTDTDIICLNDAQKLQISWYKTILQWIEQRQTLPITNPAIQDIIFTHLRRIIGNIKSERIIPSLKGMTFNQYISLIKSRDDTINDEYDIGLIKHANLIFRSLFREEIIQKAKESLSLEEYDANEEQLREILKIIL